MVQGRKINEVTAGGVIVSVWKAVDPPQEHHNNFQVDIGTSGDDDWVCIGGGGIGHNFPGNYLSASFPSDDFKSWNLRSRSHRNIDPSPLTGFAIGLRIPNFLREDMVSNLKIFPNDSGSEQHPDISKSIDEGFLLLSGGAHVLDQPTEGTGQLGGNMLTASYVDSSFSWRARSKDHILTWPSRLTTFAIGIRPILKKLDGTIFGSVITSFNSAEIVPPAGTFIDVTAIPLPGFALCGGGAAVHYNVSKLIWALEPTSLENPVTPTDPFPASMTITPEQQSFTGRAKDARIDYHGWDLSQPWPGDYGNLTAYAMGIKFQPISTTPPCANSMMTENLEFVDSSGSRPNFGDQNVKDNLLNTFWMSTSIENPTIYFKLKNPKPVCKIDIAWHATNKYKFFIEVGPDLDAMARVFPTGAGDAQSQGTSDVFETYSFNPVQATYVRITVTESTSGTPIVLAQISEVVVYSNQ